MSGTLQTRGEGLENSRISIHGICISKHHLTVIFVQGHIDYGTHQVATKKPNAFGLYDMCGNVCEWCNDCYGEYNSNETYIELTGLLSSICDRVFRGEVGR